MSGNKELRLMAGDWVDTCDHGPQMVEYATPAMAYFHIHDGTESYLLEDLSGTPLTAEILRDWFSHADLHNDSGDGSMQLRQAGDVWEIALISGKYEFILVRLRFVHELQRAYELFEGTPLTRKEQ